MNREKFGKRNGTAWIGWLLKLGEHELAILVSLAVAALSGWAFVELADEVLEGDTESFDQRILKGMRAPDDLSDPWGPHWLEEVGRDYTALGGMGVLTALTLAVAGYLLLQGKRRATVYVLVAVGGGVLLSLALKQFFDRARPDLVSHESWVYTASFPSGHSMLSAVVYLTLGALLTRMHARRRLKVYFLGLAVLLTAAVGASRVYLGVHWPTDVLAGWTVGAVWALACWSVALWMQREKKVEETIE